MSLDRVVYKYFTLISNEFNQPSCTYPLPGPPPGPLPRPPGREYPSDVPDPVSKRNNVLKLQRKAKFNNCDRY